MCAWHNQFAFSGKKKKKRLWQFKSITYTILRKSGWSTKWNLVQKTISSTAIIKRVVNICIFLITQHSASVVSATKQMALKGFTLYVLQRRNSLLDEALKPSIAFWFLCLSPWHIYSQLPRQGETFWSEQCYQYPILFLLSSFPLLLHCDILARIGFICLLSEVSLCRNRLCSLLAPKTPVSQCRVLSLQVWTSITGLFPYLFIPVRNTSVKICFIFSEKPISITEMNNFIHLKIVTLKMNQ